MKYVSTELRQARGLCKERGKTGIPHVTYEDIAKQHGMFFMLEVNELQKASPHRSGEFWTRITIDGEKQDIIALAYYRYKELATEVQHKLTPKKK
jgi:hypothetical protein